MNPVGAVAHARVGADGRLLAGDPAVTALNARAGGGDEQLAVPSLATIARLAWRLGIPVSRGVTVADEDGDLDLWVRAEPDGGEVRLAISGWREQPPWRPERAAAATSGEWPWETDATQHLTFLSAGAAGATGLDAASLLGLPLHAIFALDGGNDALAGQRPLVDRAATVVATGWRVMLSATVRRDGGGAFAGLSGTLSPITTPAVLPAPALPASFTGGLDRALRTPLARIVANADSMSAGADGPIAPTYADYAADIASAGRHLLALIDDLVDLQAIERPDFTLVTEPIDLADVGRRAAGLLGMRATEAEIVVARPDAGVSAPAMGDFRRALQIAVNLLGNAIRYAPAGTTVRIEARNDDGRTSLVVGDEGKGIALADQARIFAKFGRADPGEEGGNGLGLYIARRLARAMGGELSVASAPGEGARFTLELAAAPDRRA